jgi:acetyltransferase-like isoleucine patch superfamily enzyme
MARLGDYGKFLRSGYTWRELGFSWLRLKVWSRFLSALKHSFAERGSGVVVDCSALVYGSRFITVGDGAWIQRQAWLNVGLVAMDAPPSGPILRVGKRVHVGPRTTLSAMREVIIEDDVLFGMGIYVSDHIYSYQDIAVPIKDQGHAPPGRVRIGQGAWVGTNAVIIANGIDLTIGKGSVISANSVVTESIPDYCVAAGSPAKVVKRWDPAARMWTRV